MKILCLLVVFASFNVYAQKVRENIKVKHQSQTRTKYTPEKFESTDKVAAQPSLKAKVVPTKNNKKNTDKKKRN